MLSAVAALALLFSGSGDAPARYSLNLSVVNAGVETVAARTVLIEDGSANVTVQDAAGVFEMNATLTPVQGDGDDELVLDVSLVGGDGQPQEPRLIVRRGADALIQIGQQGADGRMVQGLEIALIPLPAE